MFTDSEIWEALTQLYGLLNRHENSEREYQAFFEVNLAAFSALGVHHALSFEKSSSYSLPYDDERGYRPEPDFIGVNTENNQITIIELKVPFEGGITTARRDGNRAKFKAAAEGYISQANEYAASIQERSEAREIIKKLFRINSISSYRIVIIYSLAASNDSVLVQRLCAERNTLTEIVFFDTLFNRLFESYAATRVDRQSRPGFCFVSHLAIASEQSYDRAVLCEIGRGSTDRLLILVEGDFLLFECTGSMGDSHTLACSVDRNKVHHVRFELANDDRGLYFSLSVDNDEQELRLGRKPFQFDTATMADFTYGANRDGEYGACFTDCTHYHIDRVLSLEEKLQTYDYFLRETKRQEKIRGIEFSSAAYMVKDSNNNLVAPSDDLRPTLREIQPG